ncbi:MAG: response regulator [Actinomycetota bacterium]
MKILCIDDDQSFAKLLETILVKQHYQVELATNGQAGWNYVESYAYDLILLDLILPDLDGISFCQQLRASQTSPRLLNRDTPVLLMTALDTVTNKVMGLDAGADDYVVKPFDLEELLARIRALLRRNPGMRSPLLTWGALCLNPNNCQVTYQQQPVVLTSKEYAMLELFLRNPQQIFSPSRLIDRLWTCDENPSEGTVRTHIKDLRHKLRQVGAADILETVYKLGYRLKPQITTDKDQTQENQLPAEKISSPPSASSDDRILPELWGVWQQYRQSYRDRLSVLQQVLIALQTNTLTPQKQQEAAREAHTLIGSLGSFGLETASRLSRQVQQLLKQQEPLKLADAQQLKQLLLSLKHSLEEADLANPSAISTPPSSPECGSPLSASLLIVDDDFFLATSIATEAITWGFQAAIATNLEQARRFLVETRPQVMVLNVNFPGTDTTGLEFLATVHNKYPSISVVMLSAEASLTQRIEAVRLGSQCFLQKPIAPEQVLAAAKQVLELANPRAARLLVVDADRELLQLLDTLLAPYGYRLILLNQPQHFWETLQTTQPDLLILDLEFCQGIPCLETTGKMKLAPASGLDLCQVIRSDPNWYRLPILLLSAHREPAIVQRSFVAGADDFLSKPIVVTELLTRVRARLEQRRLWRDRDTDVLTGLSGWRQVLPNLRGLLHLAQRQQQPLSLVILDVDLLQSVNERYGDETGDRVLRTLGKLLNESFRQEDVVGRWGGGKFVIGMYGALVQDGIQRIAALLHLFSQHRFISNKGQSFQVTFSAGIAQFPGDGEEIQTLYCAADTALYSAKIQGRNCILPATSIF